MNRDLLFRSLKLGNLTLPNRVVGTQGLGQAIR